MAFESQEIPTGHAEKKSRSKLILSYMAHRIFGQKYTDRPTVRETAHREADMKCKGAAWLLPCSLKNGCSSDVFFDESLSEKIYWGKDVCWELLQYK